MGEGVKLILKIEPSSRFGRPIRHHFDVFLGEEYIGCFREHLGPRGDVLNRLCTVSYAGLDEQMIGEGGADPKRCAVSMILKWRGMRNERP